MNSFKSFLAPQMEQYLEYREGLGYSIGAVDDLRLLDCYLITKNVDTAIMMNVISLRVIE